MTRNSSGASGFPNESYYWPLTINLKKIKLTALPVPSSPFCAWMTFPRIYCPSRYFLLAVPICRQNRNDPLKRIHFPPRPPGSLSLSPPCRASQLLRSAVESPFCLQCFQALSSFLVTPQTPSGPSSLGFINFHLPCQVQEKSVLLPQLPQHPKC